NIRNYANPGLRWETTRMTNIGIDFATRNRRISGSLEYYHKRSYDLFGSSDIDYTAGVGISITKNVSSLKGKGVDLTLHTINLTGPLKWSTLFNLSHATNRVIKNDHPDRAATVVSQLYPNAGSRGVP